MSCSFSVKGNKNEEAVTVMFQSIQSHSVKEQNLGIYYHLELAAPNFLTGTGRRFSTPPSVRANITVVIYPGVS